MKKTNKYYLINKERILREKKQKYRKLTPDELHKRKLYFKEYYIKNKNRIKSKVKVNDSKITSIEYKLIKINFD